LQDCSVYEIQIDFNREGLTGLQLASGSWGIVGRVRPHSFAHFPLES
jgi:hypothetical protein